MKRLGELCTRLGVSGQAEEKLARLLELVASDPSAPTSVTAPDEALDVHVADSLSALPLIRRGRGPARAVDIGSGAGFPGLPLAIALERVTVELVEATTRKCRFIERAIAELALPNASAICARAEEWAGGEGAERYDLALVRAVAPLATLLEYASPLLIGGGRMLAWKGGRDPDEERAGAAAAAALGMTPIGVHPVTPFPAARSRHLHEFEKTGPTPAGIPRRVGRARKRPFGAE